MVDKNIDARFAGDSWLDDLQDLLTLEQADAKILSYSSLDSCSTQPTDYFRMPRYPYPERLKLRDYLRQNYDLQVELVKLQNWIQDRQLKVLLLFEGRDTAGKGSAIKGLTQNLNPRHARVVALAKPTSYERSQWYFQRYTQHLPSSGEIVFFDRSWYNRAGVERVMGFCSDEEYWQFVRQVPLFEHMLVDTGITLMKFYLSISKEEQALRIQERRTNPLKRWKLSLIDAQAQDRWDAYSDAKEETLQRTAASFAPWTIIKADDKLRVRLNVARHILNYFDYADKDYSRVGDVDPLLLGDASAIYGPADRVD